MSASGGTTSCWSRPRSPCRTPDSGADIARTIDAAERHIREAEPPARVIYLEPDIDAVRRA
jgi:hypothetical protein